MQARRIIGAVIGMVIGLVVSLSTLGTVVDLVDDVNTTGWDFTGYSGAIALLDLIPFVYVASVLLLCTTAAFAISGAGNYIDLVPKIFLQPQAISYHNNRVPIHT